MSQSDPILEQFQLQRVLRGPLSTANARGDSSYNESRVSIELECDNDLILHCAFEVVGDSVLVACASFLMYCAQGKSRDWASCVRAWLLAEALRLPHDDFRPQMTVAAFRAALSNHRPMPSAASLPKGMPGAPRGHRKPRVQPTLTKRDLALLRPGETDEQLFQERLEILGVIQNLDGCLSIAAASHSFRGDESSGLREDLLASAASVQMALSALSAADRSLVSLVGLRGLTEAEAATALGISQPTVHERLRTIAYRIQKILRDRPMKPPPPPQS